MWEQLAAFAEALFPASRWAMVGLSFVDLLLTHRVLRITGPEWETNPVSRWAWRRFGPRGLWACWVIIVTAMVLVFDRPMSAMSMCAYLALLVINNLLIYRWVSREDCDDETLSRRVDRQLLLVKVMLFVLLAVLIAAVVPRICPQDRVGIW